MDDGAHETTLGRRIGASRKWNREMTQSERDDAVNALVKIVDQASSAINSLRRERDSEAIDCMFDLVTQAEELRWLASGSDGEGVVDS